MSTIFILSILLLISVAINVVFFIKRGAGSFNRELDAFFSQNMTGRISLAFPFSPSSSAHSNITSHLNTFIEKLRSSFKNVFSLGFSLTTTSDGMKDSSKQLLAMSDETSFQASQVATAMEEMSATVGEIARNASTAAESSTATMKNAESAESDITENMKSIEHLSQNVSSWADTNRALSEATSKIDEIILVINDIADQTNLLALNAAIEAARAGEHGRGFAIVADEVRKLADKTGQATEEIGGMIKNVKTKAENSLDTMDSTLKGVDESIDRSKHAEESLNRIVSEVKQVTDMIQQIAVAAEEQSKVSDDVLSNMEKVSGNAAETKDLAANISESGDALASVSLKLYNQLCSIKIDRMDDRMENLLTSCSSDLSSMFADSLKRARTDLQSLFDENYIGTGEEGKFSAKSNNFFDSEVLPLLQKWSQTDKKLIYAVAMDRNGYMPTHTLPARSRVKMNDPISLNGAKSSTIMGQAFRRPIAAGGELVVDIACPIIIESRHWGCLRIGYLPEMG